MKPVTASSTRDAQQHLSINATPDKPITLAVIDSEMPDEDGFALVRWIRDQEDLNINVIMTMIQSSTRSRTKLNELGVKKTVIKPVRPSDLLDAILIAVGIEKTFQEAPVETTGIMQDHPARSLQILVVEDTLFNQKFILRLLESRGHRATIAENGRQAIEQIEKESYDLVLMDVQMPIMDGLEATREIRNREKQTGRHIPIIAMTAHAMKGDRERCLEAGMDNYISKPISSEMLFKTIWALLADKADSASTYSTVVDTSAVFDKSALLKAFENDLNFFEEMVNIFLSEYPSVLGTLKEALETKEAETVVRMAHTLKGMFRNFQAETAAQIALKIETAGRKNEFDGVGEVYEQLVDQVNIIKDLLLDLVKENKT
jgi:CheY-like chemotaxis protein